MKQFLDCHWCKAAAAAGQAYVYTVAHMEEGRERKAEAQRTVSGHTVRR